MIFTYAALAAATLIGLASGHAALGRRIPGYARLQGITNGDDRAPINSVGIPPSKQEFCKGYQRRGLGGKSPKKLSPGENQFDLDSNMAAHNGGSMQVSLSFDDAKTFKVIKSFIGGFPRNNGGNTPASNQVYDFEIPENTRAGPCIFSWSWSNEVGNREFYQDCAPIIIEGSGTSTLEDYPDMFVANAEGLTKTCKNDEGVSVEYPNPGKSVERGKSKTRPPKGDCGKSGSSGGTPTSTAEPPKPTKDSDAKNATDSKCTKSDSSNESNSDSGSDEKTYTVASGDTCNKIAQEKGTTFAKLRNLNPEINEECTNLEVGQKVMLMKRSRIMILV